MRDFRNKVALVTGGASGIGNAIARRLVTEGASVVITDLQPLGNETAIASTVYPFELLEQDVCDERQWVEIVRLVEERHGRLDVLVNNAGILGPMDAVDPENTRLADWRKVFAVNVEGVFLGCRAAIPAMRRAGGGSIINISSIAGLLATPYATAYGASKATVRQLTKSVAQYCAQQKLNIRCNSIHPGDVLTPMALKRAQHTALERGVSVQDIIEEARAIYPLGDFIQVEEVAAAASFLASEESRHMTGAELVIDGGLVSCDTYHMILKRTPGNPHPGRSQE